MRLLGFGCDFEIKGIQNPFFDQTRRPIWAKKVMPVNFSKSQYLLHSLFLRAPKTIFGGLYDLELERLSFSKNA